jgi:hypothetical protein
MVPKLHTPPEVQLLVNTAMSWAEKKLRAEGRIPAAAAWLPYNTSDPGFRVLEGADSLSIARQESLLVEELQTLWRQSEVSAMLLAAPVLYGRKGSTERSEAVRLHVEAAGFCVDILMPYRIRAASRWRGSAQNRVHFSHPVAQESDPRFRSVAAPHP